MQTLVITSESEWEPWRKPWNALAKSNPMLSMEWLMPWWRHYGQGHELHIIAVTHDNQLLGVVPSYLYQKRLGNQLRFLGSGVVSSDYMTAMVDPQNAAGVYAAISDHLRGSVDSGALRGIESVQWEGISGSDAWTSHLTTFAELGGYSFRSQSMVHSWSLPLPSSWNGYLEGQRGRSVCRKAKKCVSRVESGELNVRFLTGVEGLDEGMKELIRLHQARRESIGDDGCFADPKFDTFLREAVAGMVVAGKASFSLCESAGRVIGVHLLFVGSDTIFMYQSGVDPSYLSLEPGHVIIAANLREAISNGYQHYDFLRGDEPYKSFWGAQPIPLQRIVLAPPTLKAQAIEAVHRNLSWLRSYCSDLGTASVAKS